MKTLPLAIIATAAMAASCSHGNSEHLASINPDYIDTTIAPGHDFYNRINKGWIEANPLTGEHARYGRFDVINDTCEARVRSLVEGLGATNPQPGSVAHKVWTVYSLAMDTARRNAEGATPILADLKKIEETPHEGMADLFLWMHANYGSPFFGAGPMEDMTNSMKYAMYVSGAGLGMGDRDYYLLDDERNTTVRDAYRKLIDTQMQNAGYSAADAARITDNVLKIETAIARDTKTREESRNIVAMYNPFTIANVKSRYPDVDWDRFFVETMGIQTPDTIIVTDPKTVATGTKLMASLSDREIKDYYLWDYVSQAASKLSDDFTQASFEFSKVKSGV